jgi:cerevisin
VYDSSTRNI